MYQARARASGRSSIADALTEAIVAFPDELGAEPTPAPTSSRRRLPTAAGVP